MSPISLLLLLTVISKIACQYEISLTGLSLDGDGRRGIVKATVTGTIGEYHGSVTGTVCGYVNPNTASFICGQLGYATTRSWALAGDIG